MKNQTKTIKYPSGAVLTRTFDDSYEVWTIENKAMSTAEFTMDLRDCRNVWFNAEEDLDEKTISIPSRKSGSIRIWKEVPYKFAAKFFLTESAMALKDQLSVLDKYREKIEDNVDKSEVAFKELPYEVMSKKDISRQMKSHNIKNFTDPHFPPKDTSIYNVLEEDYPYEFAVHWRRPHEFMENPIVFENDIDPNDIKQGQLGDCWFLSALSSLAERPGMVKRLFITKEYNEEGIYQIRICKNGEWITVTIDDYIPCRYNGGPMFSRGAGNEMWVMLMEKAYAKVHGCYQALSAGFTKHAMMDLTGCPTEHIKFPKWTGNFRNIQVEAEKIFRYLLEADKEGHLISTETSGVDTITEGGGPAGGGGLVSGHAYSIIQVKEGLGEKLLNIRNPWGQFEWDGAWADNAPEWTDTMIRHFKPVFDEEDGAFWICLEDFMEKFEAVNICKVENYEEARFKGKFIKATLKDTDEVTVISKFFYTFNVAEENEVTIGLHQEDERIQGAHLRRNMDVGFVILSIDNKNNTTKLYDYCSFSREREVFKTVTLKRGSYAVVPLTSGALMQKTLNSPSAPIEPSFTFEDAQWPHPYYSSVINDIFRKLDLAANGVLSAGELNQFGKILGDKFFLNIKQSDFSTDAYREINSCKEGITVVGFKQLLFRNFDDKELRSILNKMGYDQALNSYKSRAFVISFQAYDSLRIKINDILTTDYYNTAWEKLMDHLYETIGPDDTCTQCDEYTIFAYSHEAGMSCSYACINHTDEELKVEVDLTSSDS